VIHPVFLCQKVESVNDRYKIWRVLSLCIWRQLILLHVKMRLLLYLIVQFYIKDHERI